MAKKKTTKKKTTKKKAARKKATKKTDTQVNKESTSSDENQATATQTATQERKEPQLQPQPQKAVEYEQVDSVALERIKSKFTNLTGYPIRVMCGQKWAEIPHDPNKIARVLYSIALNNKIEDIDIYSHGINSVTGVPDPIDGVFNIVLPEVRFILQNRNDLLTHGELIYDGQTQRPIGFKNLFCSPGNNPNFVSDDRIKDQQM